ncbi:MAG: hypothetical protein CL840_12210 [Crocinitomicaceae bacterium]|nr:hypothetical protein [Crocinitomicaceae bacterium]|tara:strand:+ start:6662 stop:6901 length:240 start_codon:yes stop_codon:yes gene_type:complete
MDGEKDSKKSEGNFRQRTKNYAKFSSLAFQMAIIIGGGTYLGNYLDEKAANEFPIWTLVLSLTSVAASLYYVIKEIIKK